MTKTKRNTIKLQFRTPKLIEKKIEDGSLHLKLDWYQHGIGQSIITKMKDGYKYEDVGMMKRTFSSVDSLLWEYELPQSLKTDIESLPIQSGKEEYWDSDKMNESINSPEFKKDIDEIMEVTKQHKFVIW